MNDRIDELMINAKPQVDPAVRERVRAAIGPGGAADSARPSSLTLLLRVAALVMIALGAGVVTAYLSRPPAPDTSLDSRVSNLRERVDSLEWQLSRDQLHELEAQVEQLELQRAESIEQFVNAELDAREARRQDEWRERHIEHVRRHFAEEAEATVAAYREELELTPQQETQVRELLDEQGRKLEEVISGVYSDHRHHHHDRGVHDKLKAVSVETTEKLTALLKPDQREHLPRGAAVISTDPQDWAPSDDFQDASDVDAMMNWMTISEE